MGRKRINRMVQGGVAAALLACLFPAMAQAQAQTAPVPIAAAPEQVYFGVRVLRAEPGTPLDWSLDLPADCPTCQIDVSDTAAGQNPLEIFFHIVAPNDREVLRNLRLHLPPDAVRRVLVSRTEGEFTRTAPLRGSQDAVFRKERNGVAFDLFYAMNDPQAPGYELGDVTGQYTYIRTPGVDIRVEHAHPERVNGPYRDGPWPARERQAALNLQFAAREAIRLLSLDQTVIDRDIGVIVLSGFDTNYPTLNRTKAHGDYPAHWHMQIYWNGGDRFRRVGHKYIDATGLLTDNLVSISDSTATPRSHNVRLPRGETDVTADPAGRMIYSNRITPEGHFELGAENGTCRFTPLGAGFDSGISLDCGDKGQIASIRAEDDLERGELRVYTSGDLAYRYVYDRDSAKLLWSETLGGSSALTSADEQLHPGLRHHVITRAGETPMRAHVVTIDLEHPGFRFGVTPKDNSQGMEHVARLSSEYLDEIDARLVVNASYFLPFRGGSRAGDDYYPHVGQPVSVSGAALSGGHQVSPVETDLDERVDSIVCFAGARVAIFDGQVCDAVSSDGVAAGPRLLNTGRRLPFHGAYAIDRHPRTAIGVSEDQKTAWIVVVDGRQADSTGASLDELTDIFVELGAADAINLDGGGSSTLVVEGEQGRPVILNSPIHTGVPGRERPVANHVILFQDPTGLMLTSVDGP